jgi:hypothetical protein
MFHTLYRYAFVTLTSAVLVTSTCTAQRKIELEPSPQKIKDWGYLIKTVKGWGSIPAKPEEKHVVGHWKPNLEQARIRGDYEFGQLCELTVVRIPPQATKTPTSDGKSAEPEDNSKRPTGFKQLDKLLNPKSLEEYIEANYEGASKRWTRKALKGGKMAGDCIEFGKGNEAIMVGAFVYENVEWGIVYTAFEENYKKTWQEIYLKSIQSFQVYESVNDDTAIAARKDPNKLKGDAKREALKASIAANPGWYAVNTPHYVFMSNSKNRSYIESLAKEVEIVRERIYMKLFPPRNQEESISPVRVLDTEAEYHQYGGPGGSAGYFSSDSGELVLFTKFEDVTKAKSAEFCRSVMFHEAFHQYVHFAIGDVSPHSWFNEGHGDYFAGMVVNGTNITFNTFSWRVQFLKQHMRERRDLIPVRSLIRYPQREYYSNAGLKYSEGWALIYYLREITKDKRQKAILDTYFKHVADNIEAFRKKKKESSGGEEGKPEAVPGIPGIKIENFEDREKVEKILSEAVDKAFEGVDLEALDKDFRAWVDSL